VNCNLVSNLNAIGWYCGNASNTMHTVSGKTANAWGLRDMSGNVREWCWDTYGAYSSAPQSDPRGPSSGGSNRVRRGGSWSDDAQICRAAQRGINGPGDRDNNLGLRPARSD